MPSSKKYFSAVHFANITKQSLYKRKQSLACPLEDRNKPVAARLQSNLLVEMIVVIITKTITKENVPRITITQNNDRTNFLISNYFR